MTKRTQFKKAIRTLEKLKNGQLIDTEDMNIDEIINLLKESCPKPYEIRKKTALVALYPGKLRYGTEAVIMRADVKYAAKQGRGVRPK